MKNVKFIGVLLCFVMVVLLFGCGATGAIVADDPFVIFGGAK